MYDFSSEITNPSGKLKRVEIGAVPELSDLSTPEVSFDLQNFIENSNRPPTVEVFQSTTAEVFQPATAEVFFRDILTVDSGRQNTRKSTNIPTIPFDFQMPQSAGFGSDRYASEAGVKQEPAPGIETQVSRTFAGRGTSAYAFAGLPTISDTALTSAGFGGAEPRDLGTRTEDRKSSKKTIDKGSDEYRRRRERNNIAVRKSREKAKQRCKDTERRVSDLVDENGILRKRVELLNKELSVLKNLLQNVGVATESTVVKHMD